MFDSLSTFVSVAVKISLYDSNQEEVLDRVEGELPSGSRDSEVIRCGGSAGCGAAVVCCPDHFPDIRARHNS